MQGLGEEVGIMHGKLSFPLGHVNVTPLYGRAGTGFQMAGTGGGGPRAGLLSVYLERTWQALRSTAPGPCHQNPCPGPQYKGGSEGKAGAFGVGEAERPVGGLADADSGGNSNGSGDSGGLGEPDFRGALAVKRGAVPGSVNAQGLA